DKIHKANFKPDVIFAICPGGVMIAEWLSRKGIGDFRNPIPVRVINLSNKRSSDGVIAESVVVKDDLTSIVAGFEKKAKVLLVNDISRGGASLKAAHDFLNQYFEKENIVTASLFCHEDARAKPIHFTIMTKKTIRFEWKEK
ncbi:hypothetical protein KAX97_13660, partial [candidate division WOR-3 bacterium]|nr:hypothetical protein [candidate division WOR-3 bacterium]